MQEQLVSFQTAKLAKFKGFNCKCLGNYHLGRISGKNHIVQIQIYKQDWNNYLEPNNINYQGKKLDCGQLTTSAPTQGLLQKWLREVHNSIVEVVYSKDNNCSSIKFHSTVDYFTKEMKYEETLDPEFESKLFLRYEDALEIGLQEAIKLIK